MSSAAFFSDIIEKGVVLLDFSKYFFEVAWQVTCAVHSAAGVSVTVALPREMLTSGKVFLPLPAIRHTALLLDVGLSLPPDPALFSTALVKFLTAKYEDR